MWLVMALGVAARFLTKYIITKALLVLGLGFVSYQGVGALVDNLEAALISEFNTLPGVVYEIAALCGVDVAITIVISTLTVSMTIRGVSAGAKILTTVGRV